MVKKKKYYIIKVCCFDCKKFEGFYITSDYKEFFNILNQLELENKSGGYIIINQNMKEIERRIIYD